MRGSSYLGIFLTLFSCVGIAKILGLDVSVIILGSVGTVAYFGGCYIVGWVDEKRGIWKHENSYGVSVVPENVELVMSMRELVEANRRILKYIESTYNNDGR